MFQIEDMECFKAALADAGCDSSTIARCLQLEQVGKGKEQLRILMCHRCRLVEEIHQIQEKVDCLDYLLYQLKKEQ